MTQDALTTAVNAMLANDQPINASIHRNAEALIIVELFTIKATLEAAIALRATITQVEDAALGLVTAWKYPVVVATTVDISLTGEQTIDGVLTSASRILVKNQSAPAQNGIYVTAAGAWSRSTDADSAADLHGAAVTVQQGTTQTNSVWLQTTDNITLGSSSVVWTRFPSTVQDASSILRGIARLYAATGNNTDGSMDQNSITQALALKANAANPAFSGTATGLTKAMVGLSAVDNTADSDKEVSTPQQTALDLKANKSTFVDKEIPTGLINGVNMVYTILNTPIPGSEHVYLDGQLMDDYEIDGTEITMDEPPVTESIIRISYRK